MNRVFFYWWTLIGSLVLVAIQSENIAAKTFLESFEHHAYFPIPDTLNIPEFDNPKLKPIADSIQSAYDQYFLKVQKGDPDAPETLRAQMELQNREIYLINEDLSDDDFDQIIRFMTYYGNHIGKQIDLYFQNMIDEAEEEINEEPFELEEPEGTQNN